ncbi:unnamed protein product [Clonostachys byssicola]|uniref:Uncharacterized protein n=1 Tax=Clonostachys byssicola TaxID=160290 RepID=A0A9N9TXX2_9HYPO|nr:unnamed protein product [Clonostachys byssicola]
MIMSLAAWGDGSLLRIAWPLFVTAIVTDNCRYHDWMRNRLQRISKFGKNYERAYQYRLKMSQIRNAERSKAGAQVGLDSGGLGAFVIWY